MNQKSSLTLGKQKKPKDDARHLDFSLTKKVINHEDYGALARGRAFANKKTDHEKELADQSRREGFWQTLKQEVAEPGSRGLVKIKIMPHKRSPYLVQLGSGQNAPPAKKGSPPDKKEQNEWRSEVERLRKEAAGLYKNRTQKIRVNFLKGKRRLVKLKSALPRRGLVWIFEFLLSIPLLILLFTNLGLKLTNAVCLILAEAGRVAGRAFLFLTTETFLGLITLFKAVIVIPLKIIGLGCLVGYRLVASGADSGARAGKEISRALKNSGRSFKGAPGYFLKRALAAAGLALALLAPLKFISQSAGDMRTLQGRVLGSAKEALSALGQSADSIKQGQASGAAWPLQEAGVKFSQARESLDSINLVLRGIMKLTPQGQGAEALLIAGEELTQAGQYIAAALAPFIGKTERPAEVITAVDNLSSSLILAAPHLRRAREELAPTDPDLIPEAYRERFASLNNLLPAIEQSIAGFIGAADKITQALGGRGERRYAVLFQNNNELRPAGGFIGSLALVTVDNGRVSKIEVPGGGAYDFQGYLTKHILSPKPLGLINARWQMQDANWYPDWPTSAEKVAWFLENSGQSSVDGVIGVQATVLQKLLAVLGPVEFPEYKEKLTADNVIREIQTAVEVEYDKTENRPKKYIAELAPRVMDKILESVSGQFFDLFGLVRQAVEEKDLLFYFRDPELNREFLNRGWEPSIVNSDLDYLGVVHANIGGGKTDGVIEESWRQRLLISKDGAVEAELTISRHHRGNPTDPFEKFNNVDYARVYAPLGSEFISGSGFNAPDAALFEKAESYYQPDEELAKIEGKVIIDEQSGTRINNEFGKTVFGNWMQVDPGNTAQAVFRYRLPFKIKPFSPFNSSERSGYSLLIQKQPGARPIEYEITVEYPAEWGIGWKKISGEATLQTGATGLASFSGILTRDSGFALLFAKNK